MALRVLVLVEDNPDDRDLIKHVLQRYDANMQVESYLSAEGAIQYLRNHTPPDLMLVDLRLPSMSGIEFIYWTRQEKMTFPIVVITGLKEVPADLAETLKMQTSGYIVKDTFTLDKFKELVTLLKLS